MTMFDRAGASPPAPLQVRVENEQLRLQEIVTGKPVARVPRSAL